MADQKTFERVCDVIRETAGLDDVDTEENPKTVGEFVDTVEAALEK